MSKGEQNRIDRAYEAAMCDGPILAEIKRRNCRYSFQNNYCGTKMQPQCLHFLAPFKTNSLQSGQRTCVEKSGSSF